MNPEVRDALDHVYSVFARYHDDYGFARHSGVSHSLRQLTRDDWSQMDSEFDMVVVLYEGDLLRHFLPRWLEWLSEESLSYHLCYWDVWDLARRLNRAGWRNWRFEEVEALRAVFKAWTREQLAKHDGQIPLDFLSAVENDLSRYLDILLGVRPLEVARWLWTVDWNADENARRWAVHPHVEAILEAAFFADPNSADGTLLSRSIQLIRSLRALRVP